MVRVDGSARVASRGQNSPQLRRAQVLQLIHISTSSRDDAVHAQRTRSDDADGETASGHLVPAYRLAVAPGRSEGDVTGPDQAQPIIIGAPQLCHSLRAG